MNPLLLSVGLVLGALFSLLMVFKILPPLDHIVKKQRGPFEACIFTRICPLLIGLPFYFFAIWMTVVIVAKKDKGNSVFEEICSDNYKCARDFAWGRARFDKDACTSPDCTSAELHARSGQKPLHFPRLGLGEELSPSEFTVEYTCDETDENLNCLVAVSEEDECVCEEPVEGSVPMDCERVTGCLNDIDTNERTVECLENDSENRCTKWKLDTDSRKQFSFQTCECTSEDCLTFTCEVFVMKYFYPNVFYAGLATILFVLPTMIGTYIIIKTHLRKIFPCTEQKLYVYSQEAGIQEEYKADNLVTGGFNKEQKQKKKFRPFTRYDAAALVAGPSGILFFSWQIVLVSGRVGLSFILTTAVLIGLVEGYRFYKHMRKLNKDLDERIKTNNPMAERANF